MHMYDAYFIMYLLPIVNLSSLDAQHCLGIRGINLVVDFYKTKTFSI